MNFVVDASVAFKWFVAEEPHAVQALAIVRDEMTQIAPDILIAEVCNAARRSARLGRINQAQVGEIAAVLPRFFEALIGAAALAPRAVVIAGALDHPVSDCLYLALSEEQQTRLVTADTQLLEKLRNTPWEANALYLPDYATQG